MMKNKRILFFILYFLYFLCLVNPTLYAHAQQPKITLYANFFTGSGNNTPPKPTKSKEVFLDQPPQSICELANSIGRELSQWTGLHFIFTATRFNDSIKITWDKTASLFSSKYNDVSLKEFYFSNHSDMQWFMLNSLYQSLLANLTPQGIHFVYYCKELEKDLVLKELSPPTTFTINEPYLGSPYYAMNSKVKVKSDYSKILKRLHGVWLLHGMDTGSHLFIHNNTSFELKKSNGMPITGGYLSYEKKEGKVYYYGFNFENAFDATLRDVFHLNDPTTINHIRKTTSDIYIKKNTFAASPLISLLQANITTENFKLHEKNNRFNGGYYHHYLGNENMPYIVNTAFYAQAPLRDESQLEYTQRLLSKVFSTEISNQMRYVRMAPYTQHSRKIPHPLFLVSWLSGQKEHCRAHEALVFFTQSHMYIFAFIMKTDTVKLSQNIRLQLYESLQLAP